jgi:hypothetical protein
MPGNALRINESQWECGGLRFHVFFTVGHGIGRGATGKVLAMVDGTWTEMFRFCDFTLEPHFHVPADGPQIDFDRNLGEPIVWFAAQLRENLVDFVERSGFSNILSSIDLTKVSEMADRFRQEMMASWPDEIQLESAIETWRIRLEARAQPTQEP